MMRPQRDRKQNIPYGNFATESQLNQATSNKGFQQNNDSMNDGSSSSFNQSGDSTVLGNVNPNQLQQQQQAQNASQNLMIATGPSRNLSLSSSITPNVPRGKISTIANEVQCQTMIGPFNKGDLCWLCGFPIGVIKENENVQHVNEYMDSNVCEHVIPIHLASVLTGIVDSDLRQRGETTILEERLLHSEYEYAHHYCNYVKNDFSFLSIPYGTNQTMHLTNDKNQQQFLLDNLCNIQVNNARILAFLSKLYFTWYGTPQTGAHTTNQYDSSILTTDSSVFPNPVQFHVYNGTPSSQLVKVENGEISYLSGNGNNIILYTRPFNETDVNSTFQTWYFNQYAKIMEKMIRVVRYIKEADDCENKDNSKGRLLRRIRAILSNQTPPPLAPNLPVVPLTARTASFQSAYDENKQQGGNRKQKGGQNEALYEEYTNVIFNNDVDYDKDVPNIKPLYNLDTYPHDKENIDFVNAVADGFEPDSGNDIFNLIYNHVGQNLAVSLVNESAGSASYGGKKPRRQRTYRKPKGKSGATRKQKQRA